MKLSDIKKCKVPELRSKLKELGLDPKGLRAELIGRLWSALEAGLQISLPSIESDRDSRTNACKVEVGPHNDIPPSPLETDTHHIDVKSTSAPVATMTSSYISCSIREYADTATQTDTAPQTDTAHQTIDCSSMSTRPVDHHAMVGEGGLSAERPTPLLEEDPAQGQTSLHVHDSEFRLADLSQAPVSRDAEEEEESQSWHGEEGSTGIARDSTRWGEMGRAFYEFKEEIRYKRAKFTPPTYQTEREVVEEENESVRIDTSASDLHFETDPDGSCGRPLFPERFPLLWSGCRLTHGLRGGTRASFEVRLEGKAHAPAAGLPGGQAGAEPRPDAPRLRVGWAPDTKASPLGEDELSYAYDGRGRKVTGGREEEFGEPLSDGDIIGCYLLFSADGVAEMSFHRNGRPMGVAFCLGPSVLGGNTLFPHVLCRGCSVRFRLDPAGGPWYPGPPGDTPLVALPAADRVRAPPCPRSRAECEVIMMVGLPGSGKSHWARVLMDQHPEKRYQLLGTETLTASMIGEGQRETQLQQASQCLTELIKMAARKPGNYILDQLNVFVSARRHKLQLFAGFQRALVAVVVPPTEEWRRRLALRQAQDGERIPDTALLKLKVSYSLPEPQGEGVLQELLFVELPQEEARALLHAYREEAQRLLPPVPPPQKKARLRKNRGFGPPPPHGHQWKRRYAGSENVLHRQAWGPQPIFWNSSHPGHGSYYNTAVGYSGYQGHW
ncbi:unnamed protein product [Boreogadus saida]